MDLVKQGLNFFIASGVLAWLIRSIFKLYFDKDVEKFKHNLEKESFRFNQLHQKRAQVIEALYHKLIDFDAQMHSLTKPFQGAGEDPQETKAKKAAELGNDFKNYSAKNRIYFNAPICSLLDTIEQAYSEVWIEFTTFPVFKDSPFMSFEERIEKWSKCYEKIKDEIPILKTELGKEFKTLLGVD